jgi:hypothetical protein
MRASTVATGAKYLASEAVTLIIEYITARALVASGVGETRGRVT